MRLLIEYKNTCILLFLANNKKEPKRYETPKELAEAYACRATQCHYVNFEYCDCGTCVCRDIRRGVSRGRRTGE